MMTLLRGLSVGLTLAVVGSPGHTRAYELRTHGEITRRAFELSQGLPAYLDAVGIRATDTFSLADRTPPDKLGGFANTGTPHDWMIEGAIREDDYVDRPALATLGCRLPENPPSELDRPLNHFFDVQRGGRGLTVLGQTLGFPAPDWALGRQGRGPNPDQNQFSLPDARHYQTQSLTAATGTEREENTALLFRTLGHVVHLLEDMATPQHTRNDSHAGCLELIAGGHSWFENYIETRALGRRFRTRGGISPLLILDGYSAVGVQAYEQFFTDGARRGLADFSSRNFFSAGTNLSLLGNCGDLPEPTCERGAYGTDLRAFSIQAVDGATVSGTVTLYMRDVFDALTGATIPRVPVSSRSVWDEHLEQRGLVPVFSLNTINYDAAADILVPRAVGYAAGLLDTFFRGRLETRVESVFDWTARQQRRFLRIVNRSPGESLAGDFTLYFDDRDGRRTALATWPLTLGSPDAPEAESGPLLLPDLPESMALAPQLTLAFQGRLGQEDAATVAARTGFGQYQLRLDYNSVLGEDTGQVFAGLAPGGSPAQALLEFGASDSVTIFSGVWPRQNGYALYAYRQLDVAAGRTATVALSAQCSSTSWVFQLPPVSETFPATVEILALQDPVDLVTLDRYTWSVPPPPARVLWSGTVQTDWTQTVDVTIDVTGVTFLGVRVPTVPVAQPPELPPNGIGGAEAGCGASALVTFR